MWVIIFFYGPNEVRICYRSENLYIFKAMHIPLQGLEHYLIKMDIVYILVFR